MKHGKKYVDGAKLVDRSNLYDSAEALDLAVKTATAKFDETIEAHIRLGVDSRHADQQVRGAVVLPNGTGKTVRVAVFAKGDLAKAATEAGADIVGDADLVEKIQGGWMDFDVAVASPDMMGFVGRLGKVLGPRGLMPSPKARQAKGKARLNSYDKLLNEDVKEKEEKLEIFIPNGPRLGNKVIEAKHVAKAFGDKLLFDDLNFMLPPNGIVGIIGPNGAGKTTLFRLIMGLEKADKGEFEVGETVKVAYVDQQHKDIDPNKSVYQVISGGNDLIRMGGRDINARAYLSRFNFSGADQEKLCGVLSGGERNRLHLALCLKEEGNVLLLDEPTNDIDVNTLRALEEGLEDFAGCAVVISHDRWFLDRICTHILAFEGDSNVFFFEGSYSEYEENKQKRLGKEEPTRVRYRKLMND